jgi:hypothetical protein
VKPASRLQPKPRTGGDHPEFTSALEQALAAALQDALDTGTYRAVEG